MWIIHSIQQVPELGFLIVGAQQIVVGEHEDTEKAADHTDVFKNANGLIEQDVASDGGSEDLGHHDGDGYGDRCELDGDHGGNYGQEAIE